MGTGTESIDCKGCNGDGRDPFSSWDEPLPCGECNGDGYSAAGRVLVERLSRADGALRSAGRRIHLAELQHRGGGSVAKTLARVAIEMRAIARLLDDAADAAEGHEPDAQEPLVMACGQHVHPPGHDYRDAKCVRPFGHAGPCQEAWCACDGGGCPKCVVPVRRAS